MRQKFVSTDAAVQTSTFPRESAVRSRTRRLPALWLPALRPNAGKSRSTAVMALFAGLLLLASGCTLSPRLTVNVDAIDSGESPQPVRYVLVPAVEGVDASDLHFIEYAGHIDRALQKRGMIAAGSAAEANVEIEVSYGHKRVVREFVRHSIFDDPFFYDRRCRRWHKGHCVRWYPARYDWWHARHHREVDVVTSYRVFVALEAHRIGAEPGAPALWTTRARARFARPDLRVTLPLLLTAAEQYIGVDTGRERTVVLSADELQEATEAAPE